MEENNFPNVCPTVKNQIAQFILVNSVNQVVKHGKDKEAATKFEVSKRTIHRIWAAAKLQINQGTPINLISNKLGIPQKQRVIFDAEQMKAIPFLKRSTIRKLAHEMKISKSNVGRWVKSGVIRAHTNALKPELTHKNQMQRIQFSLNAIEVESVSQKLKFKVMYEVVHIDAKWFYMSKDSERYYMVPGETEPHRTCKSKRFIPKVMFMCAVSRPIISDEGHVLFDGKIGLWPFTQQIPAKRNSKNRPKGTMVTTPIDSVTKEGIKACIVNQVIPAIKSKWPPNASKQIIIQQDNARPHINDDDIDFRAAATSNGFNIKLVCQPPNSPDTNINDLGFFRAIQSLQTETASYNVDDLVKNVLLSYHNLTTVTLNNVFVSLQSCLVEILKAKGHNNYKLPHMSKSRLIREGRLPISIEIDEELVRASIQIVQADQDAQHMNYDISGLISALGY